MSRPRRDIDSGEWSVGAAWLDFDNDGLLDLFVVNYVRWTPEFDTFCGDAGRGIRVYCHPRLFEGTANRLYRNLGNGRFADVSRAVRHREIQGQGNGRRRGRLRRRRLPGPVCDER